MDIVSLVGLEVDGTVGVYAQDRAAERRLRIDVEVVTSVAAAAAADALDHTVDYDHLAELCRDVVHSGMPQLIETIAVRIAELVLSRFPRAREARVRVAKPSAVPGAKEAAVEVWRGRYHRPVECV